jgi:hypothetical protein
VPNWFSRLTCDVYSEFDIEEVYTLPSNHRAGDAQEYADSGLDALPT